jgi:hypothetical protein
VHGLRAQFEQPVADGVHGLAVIEDVVEHEHGAPAHQRRRPHAPLERCAARQGAVARSVDVVEVEREAHERQDLAREHHCPAHHRQHQGVLF